MKLIRNLFSTLLCTIALLTLVSCLRDSYAVKLTGPITPGENRVEFNPEATLKPDKDWQEVGLELSFQSRSAFANSEFIGKHSG